MNNFPSTQSGFKEVNEGVLEEVIVLTEKQGIYCMNPAHLGSVCNVRKDNFFCDTCHRYGPPTKEFKKQLPELQPIIFSRPIFVVVLVSRSSNGHEIPEELYVKLRKIIETQQR